MGTWNLDASERTFDGSVPRTVILSVTMVGFLAALASIYEYYHLMAMDRLDDYTETIIPILAVFLAVIVSVILFSKGRFLKPAVWSIFALGSTHLLTTVTLALLVSNDIALAAEHALWIMAVQVCLFATLERRAALGLSAMLFLLLAAICFIYSHVQSVSLVTDARGGFLVQLVISNGAILVLLGGLSAFREVALVEKTRAEASEDHAVLLTASVEEAIAERRRALRALDKAEAATQAREAFLASMSHELRTPLNAIIGFAQILEMDDLGAGSPAAKRQEYATDIRNSGEHMLGLIGQILEYSRLESEGVDVRNLPQPLAKVVESAIRMIAVLADAKQITLERLWDTGDDFVAVTDERALSQVLLNLLSNAVKYTPASGKICIRITREEGGSICVEIEDTGVGIPEDKIARVCDPFFQVGDQKTAGTAGTGLGLSIVMTLLTALGAHMEIESKVGKGTCCRVRIPTGLDAEMTASSENEAACLPVRQAAS